MATSTGGERGAPGLDAAEATPRARPIFALAALLGVAFFLSGVAALGFETLWFRQLGQVVGSAAWSSALVLAGFMAGLALGNAGAMRFGDHLARPLRTCAVLESVVGTGGLALVLLLPRVSPALAPGLAVLNETPVLAHALRLLIAFALLLVPATAMGASLPLAVRTIAPGRSGFGAGLGWLYGCNTLGGVVGAAAVESLAVPALGIARSGAAATSVALIAAVLLSLAGMRREARVAVAPSDPAGSRRTFPSTRPRHRRLPSKTGPLVRQPV